MDKRTSLFVLFSGTLAFTALSEFIYKMVNSAYEINPTYDAMVSPIAGAKQVLSTQKNKNPKRHNSISLDK
jgi:hypothetical protein